MVTRWLRRGVSLAAVMAPALSILGCGGDDGGSVDKFVGTWTHTQTTRNATCTGAGQQMQMLSGTFEVQRGSDSPLVLNDGPNCLLKMDAGGDIATIRPNQTCQFGGSLMVGTMTISYTVNANIMSGQFVVTPAGATVLWNGSGTASVTVPGSTTPTMAPCQSVSLNGMATKK